MCLIFYPFPPFLKFIGSFLSWEHIKCVNCFNWWVDLIRGRQFCNLSYERSVSAPNQLGLSFCRRFRKSRHLAPSLSLFSTSDSLASPAATYPPHLGLHNYFEFNIWWQFATCFLICLSKYCCASALFESLSAILCHTLSSFDVTFQLFTHMLQLHHKSDTSARIFHPHPIFSCSLSVHLTRSFSYVLWVPFRPYPSDLMRNVYKSHWRDIALIELRPFALFNRLGHER